MLVITRGPDECIRIGDNIVLRVLRVERGHAVIGIEAPREIPVHRTGGRRDRPPQERSERHVD